QEALGGVGARGDVGAGRRKVAVASPAVELGRAEDQLDGLGPVRQVPDGVGVETTMDFVGGPVTTGAEADGKRGRDRQADGVGGRIPAFGDDLVALQAQLFGPPAQADLLVHDSTLLLPRPSHLGMLSALPFLALFSELGGEPEDVSNKAANLAELRNRSKLMNMI